MELYSQLPPGDSAGRVPSPWRLGECVHECVCVSRLGGEGRCVCVGGGG